MREGGLASWGVGGSRADGQGFAARAVERFGNGHEALIVRHARAKDNRVQGCRLRADRRRIEG